MNLIRVRIQIVIFGQHNSITMLQKTHLQIRPHSIQNPTKQSPRQVDSHAMGSADADATGVPVPHCLLLPYPVQGHINPILQFAKRLSHKGTQITLALTKSTMAKSANPFRGSAAISVRPISDGFDDGGRAAAGSLEEYIARFELVGRETLVGLLREMANSGRPVGCVVYDPFLPWALDVAKGFGLLAAPFFTQSCAVNSVYHQVYCGRLKLPLEEDEVAVVAPDLPVLQLEEMPSFIYAHGSYPTVFETVKNQFVDIERADWVFANTFYELEDKVINRLSTLWPVRAIGPTIPSMCLDKRLQDDKEYGLILFTPSSDICINWLNQQQSGSVIYVAFGSLAELNIDQTQELARALTSSDKPFIWVVRKSEESKLPSNFSMEKGLIVSWCAQLEVLAHDALGCFITHCGWNSTLEGLSSGVPMVAMPQWTDQSTNAKFVADVWGVGIWAKKDDRGIVREGNIVQCIKRVMEGEDGAQIQRNAKKWREVARKAVDEGGSSDKNIQEFVDVMTRNAAYKDGLLST